jgi:toxin HigB-1
MSGSASKSQRLPRLTAPDEDQLTAINMMFILCPVIQTFADSETEGFYTAGKSRRMPTEIRKRAAMRLLQLNAATQIEDLRLPPSNRLEQLHGDRTGQWSIRINDQWRVCFRFKNGDAFDVTIVDYH